MTHIVLACAFGMSTSMLVQRMPDEAAKRGLDVHIRALSETDVTRETGSMDVLLGPQLRFQLKKFQTDLAPLGTPVDVIEMTSYGRMNGPAVLDKALALMQK